ncbi:RNA ligase/cyclic nucleotide phosphodiesterase [Coniochaeta sp. 2T2.1]|nr:RNA ligase/cyclic nucleotide phosphodiesterase [Coniochaeta sp. 2T2.1]
MSVSAETSVDHKRPKYPIGVPAKFSADGVVQRFPGNTTVCHIAPDSVLQAGLYKVHATLGAHPILSRRIHLLPPSSWHMTVLDGVREAEREPGMWPADMAKQSLAECTAEFAPRLRRLGLALESEGLAPPYRMRVLGFDRAVVGIGLEVEGATPEEDRRMWRLRDRLADTLGFRAPNHETYRFHVSMAYLLRHIDGAERDELDRVFAQMLPEVQVDFELGAVEFCSFDNMYAFPRLLSLC